MIAAAGIALLLGPRRPPANDLTPERRAPSGGEEKAEIAAHLHDGVLQTLALIQHRAGPNREVAALARRQERELRDWLYRPGTDPAAATSLSGSLTAELAEVEDDQQVPVDWSWSATCPSTTAAACSCRRCERRPPTRARHSGADRVDVYVEVEADALTGYVRDRGQGFDPDAVADDRRGLADSIIGRTRRAGGTATVRSHPGEGTEVSVRVPRVRP